MDRTLKNSRIFYFVFFLLFFSNTYAQDDNQGKPGFTMGALGDSITTATNASGLGNQLKYSWATGKEL